MKSTFKTLLALLLVGVVILTFFTCMNEENSTEDSSGNEVSENKEANEEEKEEEEKEEEKVLYSDGNIKVSYVNFTDTKIVTTFNLLLKIENNMDKEVMVSLTDGYANDTAVTFMTGLPVEILPGKNAVGAFSFGYANLGIESIDDIKKLEFKINLRDSESILDVLLETENITISFE